MEPPPLKLVIVHGPRQGESLEFLPGSRIRIGRIIRGNNLPIKDAGISSNHLSIDSESSSSSFGSGSGKWTIRDLNSSNGTLLNGIELKPNTPHVLSDGDSITMRADSDGTLGADGMLGFCGVKKKKQKNQRKRNR